MIYANKERTAVNWSDENGNQLSASVECPEVQSYLAKGGTIEPYPRLREDAREEVIGKLQSTNCHMARICEDLINILISKGVIAESDFVPIVRQRLKERVDLRTNMP